MSKFHNTINSKFYWTAKGQGKIFRMLQENIKERGDAVKLAKKIGSTPGYVSQILNGESDINPTWKKIVKLCLSLDKVPILEIKNIDDYLFEQKLKVSYREFYKYQQIDYAFHGMKQHLITGENAHIELNNIISFVLPKKGIKQKYQEDYDISFNESEPEYV